MSTPLIVVTVLCFAAGVALSFWHARRRFRARVADRLARAVEQELARRALAQWAESQPRSPSKRENG